MSQIKNPQQFAAIEYCLQHYFTEELAPVMKQVKDELNRKQVKELADYQRSPAGILAAANTGMVASPFDSCATDWRVEQQDRGRLSADVQHQNPADSLHSERPCRHGRRMA